MPIFLKYEFWSLTLGMNILRAFGFLVPGAHSRLANRLLWAYWLFWVIFINGIYLITQSGDLLMIWGDLPLMVNSSFLLFTNLAFAAKIYVFRSRREAILNIIDEGDRELRDEDRPEGRLIIKDSSDGTAQQMHVYLLTAMITTSGWMASAEKHSLPSRAWYPYDAFKSPAYEITYVYQCMALVLIAAVNISMDSIITSLMAVCRCRLRLLNLSLRTLCADLDIKGALDAEQARAVRGRLRACWRRHEAALRAAAQLQACFTEPILAQFTVSIIIICVSAYELAVDLRNDSKNVVHIVAMLSYLLGITFQVFLYCYQGDQLASESWEIAYAAYQCEWYSWAAPARRALLVVMARSRRAAQLSAGGFATLSLTCFTAIIKASYTFFTVLQQVEH